MAVGLRGGVAAIAGRFVERAMVDRRLAVVVCTAALLSWGPIPDASAGGPYLEGSDYTVTQVSGRYVAPPSSATQIPITGYDEVVEVDLPFAFDYWGWAFKKTWIGANGHCQFGTLPSRTWVNATLGMSRGIVAPLWDDLNARETGKIVTWTDGTSPNRRFVVSWEHVTAGNTDQAGDLTFQVQFFESSNRIVFAYKPDTSPSTWLNLSYTCGLDSWGGQIWAPNETGVNYDQRFVGPFGPYSNLTGHPGTDLQFDLTQTVTLTGKVLFDRVVSDASGLGNSTLADTPVSGASIVATQPSDNLVVATATTAADGSYQLRFQGRPIQKPVLSLQTENPACVVRSSAGAASPASRVLAYDSWYFTDTNVGTSKVTAASDPGGAFRRMLAIADAIGRARDFAAPAAGAIPRLDVVHDETSGLTTYYAPQTATAAPFLVVGTGASENQDGWDAGVIVREYGRHVLASISGAQVSSIRTLFDGVTDVQNAFAIGFGHALYAASHGATKAYDGVSTTSTTVVDLEDPNPVTAKDPKVGAWVTAALFDTLDAANEPHDRLDGRTTNDRFVRCADSLLVAPDTDRFFDAWRTLGYPALELSRIWIAHGLVTDDADEPNDDVGEAVGAGSAPLLVQGRILHPGNEDWFTFDVAAAAPTLVAEVWFNRIGQDAELTLEIRNGAGTRIALGAPAPDAGPWRATFGPVTAGSYSLRIRHDSGPRVEPYSVQVFEPLRMTARAPAEWTQGRPCSFSLGTRGGVPPLTLTSDPPLTQPPGIFFSPDADRVTGSPSAAGTYQLTLRLEDSGDPVHRTVASQAFVVNPPLALAVDEFVALPAGRPWTVAPAGVGGTAPRTFTADGELPEGLALDSGTLRIHGTAAAAGSREVTLHGIDVAGSEDSKATTVVACEATEKGRGEAALAAGRAACGFWVDAVSGSTVSVAVRTAAKMPKRVLTAAWIAPDGRIVREVKLAGGKGKAKGTALPCATSGRYFLVLASDDGDATKLAAAFAVAAPKGGAARVPGFAASSPYPLEFGAIAGAKLDLQVRPDAKSGLVVTISALRAPDGTLLPAAEFVTEKKGVLRLVRTLEQSGTWTVLVVAKPGTDGTLSWKARLRQPRGGAYSAD
jgi:hypothetical protein